MSTQGHVRTFDDDGKSLLLVFLLEHKEDTDRLKADLVNQVNILRTFATAWNRGVKDVDGKPPLSESSPCNVLVVLKQQHSSSRSPNERVHITARPASATSWSAAPPSARGTVHIYSVDDTTSYGYESYFIQGKTRSRYGSETMSAAVQSAMENKFE